MEPVLLVLLGLALGAVFAATLIFLLRRKGDSAPTVIGAETIAERVRSVGKLVGLEVFAKEIATSRKGWAWLPPILLSQAKIAMIFFFEKQYHVDLAEVSASDVTEVAPGRYRVRLGPVRGTLRLRDITPYDIQAGRVLGLFDVIQVNAQTQGELMSTAQEQAARLFADNESRYVDEARRSVARRLETLLTLFGVSLEIEWADDATSGRVDTSEMVVEESIQRQLAGAG